MVGTLKRIIGCACGIVLAGLALAADVPERNPPTEPRALREAREHIGAQRWEAARRVLVAHVRDEPRDADAFNLLGYSLRHLRRLPEALKAYEEALRLDPAHRGAHEYIGEAHLMAGQPQKAQEHLSALETICGNRQCEEYKDLAQAITDYLESPPGKR